MQSFIYREDVRPSDRDHVRRISASSGFFSTVEVEITIELFEERLNKGVRSGYYFLFVEKERDVIGYTCFGPIAGTRASYNLYWIAVQNDFRHSGIGKKLLAETESLIAQRGGRRIYVETSSRDQYEPTRAFYRECSYQEEAVLKDFYAPEDSKVIYVKQIHAA